MRCLEASLLLLLPAAMVSHGCGVEVPDEPSLRANVLVAEARPPPDIPDARVMRIGMFLEAPGDTVDVTLNWNLKPAKERLEFGERPRDFSQVPKEAIVEESLDGTGIEVLEDGTLRVPLPTDTVGFLVDVDPSAFPSYCHRLDFLLEIEGRSEFFVVESTGWTLPLLGIQPSVEVLTSAEIEEDEDGVHRTIVAVDEWPKIEFSPAEGFLPSTMRKGCSTEPVHNTGLQGHVTREVEPLELSLLAGPGGISSGTQVTGACFAKYLDVAACEEFWGLTRAEREAATQQTIYLDFLAP